jgi:hypothetical protein
MVLKERKECVGGLVIRVIRDKRVYQKHKT